MARAASTAPTHVATSGASATTSTCRCAGALPRRRVNHDPNATTGNAPSAVSATRVSSAGGSQASRTAGTVAMGPVAGDAGVIDVAANAAKWVTGRTGTHRRR